VNTFAVILNSFEILIGIVVATLAIIMSAFSCKAICSQKKVPEHVQNPSGHKFFI